MADQQLTIHFDQLSDIALRGMRRAAAFVALGEKAWNDENIQSVRIDAPFGVQLLPDPLTKEMSTEVRGSFRIWVVSGAIVELVQALSLFADEFYRIAIMLNFHGKRISGEALRAIKSVQNDTKLQAKLKAIATDHGIESGLMEHADGWSRARNACAHHRGIVRARDCDAGSQELTLSWREFNVLINSETVENVIGKIVEEGGTIGFKLGRGSKTFKEGAPIDFSGQEILGLCTTVLTHVSEMVALLEKKCQAIVGVVEKARQ